MILHKIIKCFSDDQSPKLAVYMREDSNSMLGLQKNQKEQGSARMKDEQPDLSSKSLSPPPPLLSGHVLKYNEYENAIQTNSIQWWSFHQNLKHMVIYEGLWGYEVTDQLSTKRAINSGKQKLFYDREWYFQSCETIYMALMFLGFDQNPLMTLSRPFEEFSGTSKLQHT